MPHTPTQGAEDALATGTMMHTSPQGTPRTCNLPLCRPSGLVSRKTTLLWSFLTLCESQSLQRWHVTRARPMPVDANLLPPAVYLDAGSFTNASS